MRDCRNTFGIASMGEITDCLDYLQKQMNNFPTR
jgi:hypothetical protein